MSIVEKPRAMLSAIAAIGLGLMLCAEFSAHAKGLGTTRKDLLSQPEMIRKWVKKGRIDASRIPNPHWKKDACPACHKGPAKQGKLHLRHRNINQLCDMCHSGVFDHSYIHPVAVRPTTGMKTNMNPSFKNNLGKNGALNCATCHDIKAQCLEGRRNEQLLNPLFFRDGPYRERFDLCYTCHDAKFYQRRNAHDQVSDSGDIKEHTCYICHENPQEHDFYIEGDLMWVCLSCHPWKPHPGGGFSFSKSGIPNHLVVPSDEIRRNMKKSEKRKGVALPLDPNTGRVWCATCHNPHEKGIIRERAAAKGTDLKHRLRTENICLDCHDK